MKSDFLLYQNGGLLSKLRTRGLTAHLCALTHFRTSSNLNDLESTSTTTIFFFNIFLLTPPLHWYVFIDGISFGSLIAYYSGWKFFMQAEDGVGLPEQILDSSNFQNYARFYFVFTKFNLIWSLSYFALIVLNFLEVSSGKLLMNSSSSYM